MPGHFTPMMRGIYERLQRVFGLSLADAKRLVRVLTSDDKDAAMRRETRKQPQREAR